MLVAGDVYRPAAIDQLIILGQQVPNSHLHSILLPRQHESFIVQIFLYISCTFIMDLCFFVVVYEQCYCAACSFVISMRLKSFVISMRLHF